ncbi:MAG: HlyD family efflux transporter periplasmic adaptor subunit [Bacteroidota bacterium]
MEEHEKIELRSEEVQEILGTPPKWIVRWGTTVVFFCILFLLFTSYIIRYPDIIRAQIIITTSIPPESVNARMSGQLDRILVNDREIVEEGQLVAIMQSPADYNDIERLESQVSELESMNEVDVLTFSADRSLQLGAVQIDYSSFITDLETYVFNVENGFEVKTINQLKDQIRKLEQNIRLEESRMEAAREELDLKEKTFWRIQSLYGKRVSTKQQLEDARAEVVSKQREIKVHDSEMLNLQVQIQRIREEILDIQQNSTESNKNQFVRLTQSIKRLKSSIENWKQMHLIYAPLPGMVSFPEIGRKVRFVKEGEEVMAIVPERADEIVGKVRLPIPGSGKVRTGQKVIIKFDSYPYQEYGILVGYVEDKSLLPKGNEYLVVVSLDALHEGKILTSHKEQLDFDQEMQGMAEIITEDRRFIERIFEKFLALFEDYSDI